MDPVVPICLISKHFSETFRISKIKDTFNRAKELPLFTVRRIFNNEVNYFKSNALNNFSVWEYKHLVASYSSVFIIGI